VKIKAGKVSINFTGDKGFHILLQYSASVIRPGALRGEKGSTMPRVSNRYGGVESLRASPKSPNNVASTFINIVHLLTKDLRFEHGSAKLISCSRRHLTSVRPCISPHVIVDKTNSLNGNWCRATLADRMPNLDVLVDILGHWGKVFKLDCPG